MHTYRMHVLHMHCMQLHTLNQGKPEPIMLLNLPIIFPEFLKNVTYYSPKVSYS